MLSSSVCIAFCLKTCLVLHRLPRTISSRKHLWPLSIIPTGVTTFLVAWMLDTSIIRDTYGYMAMCIQSLDHWPHGVGWSQGWQQNLTQGREIIRIELATDFNRHGSFHTSAICMLWWTTVRGRNSQSSQRRSLIWFFFYPERYLAYKRSQIQLIHQLCLKNLCNRILLYITGSAAHGFTSTLQV